MCGRVGLDSGRGVQRLDGGCAGMGWGVSVEHGTGAHYDKGAALHDRTHLHLQTEG